MKRSLLVVLTILLMAVLTSGCMKSTKPTVHSGFGAPGVSAGKEEPAAGKATAASEKKGESETTDAEAGEDAQVIHVATPPPSASGRGSTVPLGGTLHASANRPLKELPADLKFTIPNQVFRGEPFVFKVSSSQLEKSVITWGGKVFTIEPGKNGQAKHSCEALLSVGLTEKSKQLPLKIVLTMKGVETEFKCQVPTAKRQYAVQKLKVDPKFVTPPAAERSRIERERKKMAEVLSRISPVKHWNLPMMRPVPGTITSLFGLRRVFNGEERGSHRGLDLDGSTGEAIHACEDGRVVLVADHYYSGQIVIIDHGLGVFTQYLHMSAFNVQEGQMVKRGDIVGSVGSTGRVTGPHLHLALSVMQNSVNPDIYLEKQYVAR